jgi:hypothetical protein
MWISRNAAIKNLKILSFLLVWLIKAKVKMRNKKGNSSHRFNDRRRRLEEGEL